MQTSDLISRRDLLKAGGAIVVSFAFAVAPRRVTAQAGAQPGAGRPVDPSEVDGLLAIHADGSVTLYTSKVDVGTGMRMALAQMAAEELGVSPSRVSVVEGDTAICPDQGGTGGSTGLVRGGTEIRAAAATARRALLALGATRLNRPAAELTIIDGEKSNILFQKKGKTEGPEGFPYLYELFGVHRDDRDPNPEQRYKMGFLDIDWKYNGTSGDPCSARHAARPCDSSSRNRRDARVCRRKLAARNS